MREPELRVFSFKLWLESDALGAFVYVQNKWTPFETGDRGLQRYIDSKRVSIDNVSPYHENIKKAIYQLLKQFPHVKNLIIDFDGFKPGTVEQFLNDKSYEKRTNPKRMIPYFYHGTSTKKWNEISQKGLSPRKITGVAPTHGTNIPSQEQFVYLSATYNAITRFAASDAARDKSLPIILRIDSKGLDIDKLHPDEDSGSNDWVKSVQHSGTIAYEGTIHPEFIEEFAEWDNDAKEWKLMPDPQPEKDDWLADLMKNKMQKLPQIPGTTAKAGWANPKTYDI